MKYKTFITSPKEYWITINPKTAEQALDINSTSIAIFKKEAGAVVCKAFLSYIVTDLIQSFNVGKTMDTNQVVFVVNAIEEDYYYLRAEELKYCFNQAKKGRYGTTYDRIDAQVIYSWIGKYLEERQQVCYDRNIEQNKIHNSQTISPVIAESLKKIFNEKEKQQPFSKELIKPEEREKTAEEKIVQNIFSEFDKLWLEESKKDSKKFNETFRTVFYENKKLNQEKYLQKRLKEINDEKTKGDKSKSI